MNTLEKNAGISLICGSILLVVTMVLHPAHADGDFKLINIISHSLAIASIPFCLFGFWGLSRRFESGSLLSNIAFAIMAMGLIASMFAAAVNGLALTFFIDQYQGALTETSIAANTVLDYNQALNHAMAYIFTGAAMSAILFWSVEMIRTAKFPKGLGYYGILLAATAIILFVTGFKALEVAGFRILIFGMVSWILIAGYLLIKPKIKSK